MFDGLENLAYRFVESIDNLKESSIIYEQVKNSGSLEFFSKLVQNDLKRNISLLATKEKKRILKDNRLLNPYKKMEADLPLIKTMNKVLKANLQLLKFSFNSKRQKKNISFQHNLEVYLIKSCLFLASFLPLFDYAAIQSQWHRKPPYSEFLDIINEFFSDQNINNINQVFLLELSLIILLNEVFIDYFIHILSPICDAAILKTLTDQNISWISNPTISYFEIVRCKVPFNCLLKVISTILSLPMTSESLKFRLETLQHNLHEDNSSLTVNFTMNLLDNFVFWDTEFLKVLFQNDSSFDNLSLGFCRDLWILMFIDEVNSNSAQEKLKFAVSSSSQLLHCLVRLTLHLIWEKRIEFKNISIIFQLSKEKSLEKILPEILLKEIGFLFRFISRNNESMEHYLRVVLNSFDIENLQNLILSLGDSMTNIELDIDLLIKLIETVNNQTLKQNLLNKFLKRNSLELSARIFLAFPEDRNFVLDQYESNLINIGSQFKKFVEKVCEERNGKEILLDACDNKQMYPNFNLQLKHLWNSPSAKLNERERRNRKRLRIHGNIKLDDSLFTIKKFRGEKEKIIENGIQRISELKKECDREDFISFLNEIIRKNYSKKSSIPFDFVLRWLISSEPSMLKEIFEPLIESISKESIKYIKFRFPFSILLHFYSNPFNEDILLEFFFCIFAHNQDNQLHDIISNILYTMRGNELKRKVLVLLADFVLSTEIYNDDYVLIKKYKFHNLTDQIKKIVDTESKNRQTFQFLNEFIFVLIERICSTLHSTKITIDDVFDRITPIQEFFKLYFLKNESLNHQSETILLLLKNTNRFIPISTTSNSDEITIGYLVGTKILQIVSSNSTNSDISNFLIFFFKKVLDTISFPTSMKFMKDFVGDIFPIFFSKKSETERILKVFDYLEQFQKNFFLKFLEESWTLLNNNEFWDRMKLIFTAENLFEDTTTKKETIRIFDGFIRRIKTLPDKNQWKILQKIVSTLINQTINGAADVLNVLVCLIPEKVCFLFFSQLSLVIDQNRILCFKNALTLLIQTFKYHRQSSVFFSNAIWSSFQFLSLFLKITNHYDLKLLLELLLCSIQSCEASIDSEQTIDPFLRQSKFFFIHENNAISEKIVSLFTFLVLKLNDSTFEKKTFEILFDVFLINKNELNESRKSLLSFLIFLFHRSHKVIESFFDSFQRRIVNVRIQSNILALNFVPDILLIDFFIEVLKMVKLCPKKDFSELSVVLWNLIEGLGEFCDEVHLKQLQILRVCLSIPDLSSLPMNYVQKVISLIVSSNKSVRELSLILLVEFSQSQHQIKEKIQTQLFFLERNSTSIEIVFAKEALKQFKQIF